LQQKDASQLPVWATRATAASMQAAAASKGGAAAKKGAGADSSSGGKTKSGTKGKKVAGAKKGAAAGFAAMPTVAPKYSLHNLDMPKAVKKKKGGIKKKK
jgi:hypothetical protein